MNREQKLAVVIGFALVLVVGVLITDHYSNAQQAQLDGGPLLMAAEPAVTRNTSVPPLPEGWAMDVTMPERDRTSGEQPRMGAPAPDRLANAGRIERSPAGPPSRFDPTLAEVTEPVEIQIGRQDLFADVEVASEAGEKLIDRIREMGGNLFEQLPNLPVAGKVDHREEPEPVVVTMPERERPAPADGEHFVQPNESLFKITERYYGQGTLWRKLAEANPGKVGESGTIRPGVRLVLPAKLGSSPLRSGSSQNRQPTEASPQRPAPQRTTTPEPAVRSYVVAKGDTLGEISIKLLGSSKRMNEIVQANRDLIDDANEIRVGMKLKIPAK